MDCYETIGSDDLALLAMLKKCARLLGLTGDIDSKSIRKKGTQGVPLLGTESRGKKEEENPMPFNLSPKPKELCIRIVHAGGREELYPSTVQAFQLMEKYPGNYVAKPDVFKNPRESLLWPEDNLLPGQKYFIIPSSTVQKLKSKHLEKVKSRYSDEGKEEMWDDKAMDPGVVNFEESIFSAKEFYASNGRLSRNSSIKGIRRKKPFVPPLPKTRSYRGPGWEPSLTSIKELSP